MSVYIGEHIVSTLLADERITSVIGDKIFPVISVKEADYPLIAYNRASTEATTTKDGRVFDTTTVNIYIFEDNYDLSLDLVQIVRQDFDGVTKNYNRFAVVGSRFVNCSEEFNDGKFVQLITFEFSTI